MGCSIPLSASFLLVTSILRPAFVAIIWSHLIISSFPVRSFRVAWIGFNPSCFCPRLLPHPSRLGMLSSASPPMTSIVCLGFFLICLMSANFWFEHSGTTIVSVLLHLALLVSWLSSSSVFVFSFPFISIAFDLIDVVGFSFVSGVQMVPLGDWMESLL